MRNSALIHPLHVELETANIKDIYSVTLFPRWTTTAVLNESKMTALAVDERSGPMKRSKFSEEQIIYGLRRPESSTPMAICAGITASLNKTFYAWERNMPVSSPQNRDSRKENVLAQSSTQPRGFHATVEVHRNTDCIHFERSRCGPPGQPGLAALRSQFRHFETSDVKTFEGISA